MEDRRSKKVGREPCRRTRKRVLDILDSSLSKRRRGIAHSTKKKTPAKLKGTRFLGSQFPWEGELRAEKESGGFLFAECSESDLEGVRAQGKYIPNQYRKRMDEDDDIGRAKF